MDARDGMDYMQVIIEEIPKILPQKAKPILAFSFSMETPTMEKHDAKKLLMKYWEDP